MEKKQTREIVKGPQSPNNAKHQSLSASFKQQQKKKNDPNTLEQS